MEPGVLRHVRRDLYVNDPNVAPPTLVNSLEEELGDHPQREMDEMWAIA